MPTSVDKDDEGLWAVAMVESSRPTMVKFKMLGILGYERLWDSHEMMPSGSLK
jgi:hypothetical protein